MDEVLRKNFYSIIAHPLNSGACFLIKEKQAPQFISVLCCVYDFFCHLCESTKRVI